MRRWILASVAVVALAFPTVALAWAQWYSANTYFGAGGFNYSSWQSSLNFNEVQYEPDCNLLGECVRMQLSLCNTSDSCYGYVGASITSGYVQDLRTIAYGKAKCQAHGANWNQTYVYRCRTSNEGA